MKPHSHLVSYVHLKLALLGCTPVPTPAGGEFNDVLSPLIAQYREKDRLLASHLCPADQRIQSFLYDYLQEMDAPKLPTRTLGLDRAGMARLLSLPVDRDELASEIVHSYRVKQGVLHNPRSDRRTTQGIFHVAEGQRAGTPGRAPVVHSGVSGGKRLVAARLKARQAVESWLWQRHVRYLESFLRKPNYAEEAIRLGIGDRLSRARQELARAESPARLAKLAGTLGAEPIEKFRKAG